MRNFLVLPSQFLPVKDSPEQSEGTTLDFKMSDFLCLTISKIIAEILVSWFQAHQPRISNVSLSVNDSEFRSISLREICTNKPVNCVGAHFLYRHRYFGYLSYCCDNCTLINRRRGLRLLYPMRMPYSTKLVIYFSANTRYFRTPDN